MIEVNKNELFPIAVSLVDESTGTLVSNHIVVYDIRSHGDQILSPPVSGTLTESTVEPGIYRATISLPDHGSYLCYASCSGFLAGTETILVSDENIYEISKSNRPHNISVIDVPMYCSLADMSPSQIARKVPFGKTDYIISIVKKDSDIDWSSPVSSGTSYAHYTSFDADLPYMMGGAF